jgi:hypothetical protein
MLIQYYRTKKGKPKGVIVTLSAGIYGWSLCSKRDTFSKKEGLSIAIGRATKAALLSEEDRFDYYQAKVPDSMWEFFTKVNFRAYKYLK